ncbi:MAG: aldose epimerase [Verrucomicrobiota bacterium]
MKTVHFQGHDVIELRCGESRALISPFYGARLLKWDIGHRPIIHWPEDADWSNVKSVRGGNPVLFPFIARHMVDGEIGKWKDAEGVIRDLPMHGFVRQMPFEVAEEDSSESKLTMICRDTEETRAGYPFCFEFTVTYILSESGLDCTYSTKNTGDHALPYFAGHHWYFAIPHTEWSDWEVFIDRSNSVRQDQHGSMYAVEDFAELQLSDESIVDAMHLLSSQAPVKLLNQKKGEEIQIDLDFPASVPWYAVTTWREFPDSGYYCVEPWLGLPNAIHHGQGLRHVAPGATELAQCAVRVIA